MAIERNVKVVISNEASKLEETIYVYQHDRGIDLTFDILENKFAFTGVQSENIVKANEIMYAGLTVKKPSGEGFFRPVLPIQENKVIFRIEHKHTDDFDEIGTYELQVHLYDKFDNRVSIPPFNLEVKPLIINGIDEILDGKVARIDEAIVDISTVGADEKILFTVEHIDGQSYVKTEWKAGDVITASKINNIELGIEAIHKAFEELEIPSIEGLVNETFVDEAIKEAIANLATNESVQSAIEEAITGLASEEFVRNEISNIEIPTIDHLATKEELSENIDLVKNDINEVRQELADLDIPSVDGLASEAFVEETVARATESLAEKSYVDEQIDNLNISEYAKTSEVDTKLQEIKDSIEEIEIPSIEGLATEEFVTTTVNNAVDGLASEDYVNEQINNIDIPEIDELATKDELEENVTSLRSHIRQVEEDLDNLEIPSIEGLATEEFVTTTVSNAVDGLASEDYVNEQINNIEFPEADLSNFYTKSETMSTEEITEALDNISVDLSDYYTKGEAYNKEEVDNLIPSIEHLATKEELEGTLEIKGIIGESRIPGCFMSAPEPPEDVVAELWIYDYSSKKYGIIQYKAINGKYIEIYVSSSSAYIKANINGSYMYEYNGIEWVSSSRFSNVYLENINGDYNATAENAKKKHIFYSTHPICKVNTSTILINPIEKSNDIVFNDYNTALEEGKYKIAHDTEIANSPKTIIEDGILEVKVIKDTLLDKITVYQEVKDINGDLYTRVKDKDNVWSEWKSGGEVDIDLSSLATKEELQEAIDNIEFPEVDINLDNYYTKDETYSKAEVDEAIASLDGSGGADVNLDDYYNKRDVDIKLNKLAKNPSYYTGILSNTVSSLVRPITQAKLDELRPNSDYGAIGVIINGVTYLAFYNKEKMTPMYYNGSSGKILRIQGSSAKSYLYILENKEWVEQDTGKNSYDIPLTEALNSSQIYLAETGISDNINYIYGNRFLADKTFTNYNNIYCDGIYRVENYTNTAPSLPEQNGILEIRTDLDIRRLTFYTKTKTYVNFSYRDDSGSKRSGVWREIGNNTYDINNYYNKTQTDTAISTAINNIDLSNYATNEKLDEAIANVSVDLSDYSTTTQTTELINELVGVPKAQLITEINEMIKKL